MKKIDTNVIGTPYPDQTLIDNQELIKVNHAIRNHPIEAVGSWLRASMTAMKKIA